MGIYIISFFASLALAALFTIIILFNSQSKAMKNAAKYIEKQGPSAERREVLKELYNHINREPPEA